MGLLRFFNFLLEKKTKRQGPMVFSEGFKDMLNKIGTPISEEILKLEGTKSEITYLDLTTAENQISYITVDNIVNHMIDIGYDNPSDTEIGRFLKRRIFNRADIRHVDVRIGKMVKFLLTNKFSDPQYAEFVDRWRSVNTDVEYTYEVWDGLRIMEAYDTDKYLECKGSELSKSCMNDSGFVELYCYIRGCKILVLLLNGKITARALLWETKDGKRILDRVYFNYGKDYQLIIKWVDDNNIWHKKRNISGKSSFELNGVEKNMNIEVEVPNLFDWKYDFPYMDTLFYTNGRYIMNYEPDGKYLKLQDTDGGFDLYSGLYDIYGNDIIDEDEYVYSDTMGGYIYGRDAIEISYSGGSGFENYSFSDWIDKSRIPKDFVEYNNKLYKIDHCVFSEKEERWIWRPEAIYDRNDWISYENFKIK